jgi:hypothetical protein
MFRDHDTLHVTVATAKHVQLLVDALLRTLTSAVCVPLCNIERTVVVPRFEN